MTPYKRVPSTHWIKGWVGLRYSFGVLEQLTAPISDCSCHHDHVVVDVTVSTSNSKLHSSSMPPHTMPLLSLSIDWLWTQFHPPFRIHLPSSNSSSIILWTQCLVVCKKYNSLSYTCTSTLHIQPFSIITMFCCLLSFVLCYTVVRKSRHTHTGFGGRYGTWFILVCWFRICKRTHTCKCTLSAHLYCGLLSYDTVQSGLWLQIFHSCLLPSLTLCKRRLHKPLTCCWLPTWTQNTTIWHPHNYTSYICSLEQ